MSEQYVRSFIWGGRKVKRQTLLKTSKDGIFWRAMITKILTEHGAWKKKEVKYIKSKGFINSPYLRTSCFQFSRYANFLFHHLLTRKSPYIAHKLKKKTDVWLVGRFSALIRTKSFFVESEVRFIIISFDVQNIPPQLLSCTHRSKWRIRYQL